MTVLCNFAEGQTLGKGTRKAPPSPQAAAEYVSSSEVGAVFRRVRAVMSKVLFGKPYVESRSPRMIRVATRADILKEMHRTFEMARPAFKFTPNAMSFDSQILAVPSNHAQRKDLEFMLRWGCIDRYGPLATSKKQGFTLEEFGDSVGYLIARLSDLTHTPSSKYSPALMP